MLLLTMGYGQGNYTPNKNWSIFSEQAKIAKPGARVSGFRSVTPDPELEKTFWDTVRDTTTEWFGGVDMTSSGESEASKSELQKLQTRTKRQKAMSAMKSM